MPDSRNEQRFEITLLTQTSASPGGKFYIYAATNTPVCVYGQNRRGQSGTVHAFKTKEDGNKTIRKKVAAYNAAVLADVPKAALDNLAIAMRDRNPGLQDFPHHQFQNGGPGRPAVIIMSKTASSPGAPERDRKRPKTTHTNLSEIWF